jgi:serine/threonine protein phosphatase PrpC
MALRNLGAFTLGRFDFSTLKFSARPQTTPTIFTTGSNKKLHQHTPTNIPPNNMGSSLPKAVDCTVMERHGSKQFQVGVAEMNGWRGSMEDAHVIHLEDKGGYFGILDGHGGGQCSKWCAKRFHETLHAQGLPADDAAAKSLCLTIDQAYLDTGTPSGSTGAMCVIRPPTKQGETYKIHVINVGDSRVLLSKADGTMIAGPGTDGGLTTDHKPDHPSERERIYRTGGTVEEAMGGVYRVNGDLAVSRCFGDADYKRTGGPGQEDRPVTANPEMGHFECNGSDFILVVCDGVSEGNFPNAQVCQLAAKVLRETGGDAAAAAEAICFKSVEMESKDNISAMIILLGPATNQTAVSPGKSSEFHPGSLIGTHSSDYVEAYTAMCVRGGVTFAEAAAMRYAVLVGRQGTAKQEAEDEKELSIVGTPAGAPGSAERLAWFEHWTTTCQDGGGQDDDVGGGGMGGGMGGLASRLGGGSPAEQQAMMQMVMGMMQQRGQAPGGARK